MCRLHCTEHWNAEVRAAQGAAQVGGKTGVETTLRSAL